MNKNRVMCNVMSICSSFGFGNCISFLNALHINFLNAFFLKAALISSPYETKDGYIQQVEVSDTTMMSRDVLLTTKKHIKSSIA